MKASGLLLDGMAKTMSLSRHSETSFLISLIGGFNGWIVYQIPMVIAAIALIFILPNTINKKLESINEANVEAR